MPSSQGARRKSRSVLTKRNAYRGLSYLLTEYKVGDKVAVDIDPSEHITTPHRRFQGKIGVVIGVGRRVLKVKVGVRGKQKILQTRFNHVKPFNGGN